MIYIFLDIDGVIAPYHPPVKKCSSIKIYGQNGEAYYTIWPSCVDVLNKIAEKYTCHFILNSTWKSHGNKAQKELEANGFRFKIEDKTPNEGGEYVRSYAISEWFKKNGLDENCTPWIAIDDEFFSYNPKHRGFNLIHCNPHTGLHQGSLLGIEKLLQEQNKGVHEFLKEVVS